jgi:dolichol-phosphate mannosyltransferase
MRELSLILPTIDEAPNLVRLLPELLALEVIGEVIVVDDGSTDGTQELVRELSRQDPRLSLIVRGGPPVLAASLQQGIDRARGALIGWMDADGSMTPADLARLTEVVLCGRAEVAVGSRFAAGGRIKGQQRDSLAGRLGALARPGRAADVWYETLLSWLLNTVVLPALLGRGVHDFTSGFLVARREALEGLRLHGRHGEYFIRLWLELEHHGRSLVELPYHILPRRHGRSKTADNPLRFAVRGARYLITALRSR